MADILSTLRELRSLEEKRAHGTLNPVEEERFAELQTLVTNRGPRPQGGPPAPSSPPAPPIPSPVPIPEASAGGPLTESSAPSNPDAEPPFVDADLTEDATEIRAEPTVIAPSPVEATVVSEPTVVAPSPVEPPASEPAAFEAVAVADESPDEPVGLLPGVAPSPLALASEPESAPIELPASAPDTQRPVPMSPAELRQWTATFAPGGVTPLPGPMPGWDALPGPTPEADEPPAAARENLTPPVAEEEAQPSVFATPPEPTPLPGQWLAPVEVPSAAVDDTPAVWAESQTAQEPVAETPAASWTQPISLGSEASTPDILSDSEPTRLIDVSVPPGLPLPDALAPVGEPTAEQPVPAPSVGSAAPIGEAFAAGESKVVVHTLGGLQKRGSLRDAHMNADFLELHLADGQREMLSTAGLKAVFFVVPIGQEVPKPKGEPVTVTLQDGHQLTGLSPDYQVGAVGFFLCPTDQRSRTARIYIYAGAVKGIA